MEQGRGNLKGGVNFFMHVVGNDGSEGNDYSEGNDENINAITNFDKDLCLPSISIEHW